MRRPIRQVTASPRSADRARRSAGASRTRERQNLAASAASRSKPPPYIVEVDEGQRAPVGKSRGVERQQQIAIFGMGVVVPAEPVVAERRERDDAASAASSADRNSVEGRGRLAASSEGMTGLSRQSTSAGAKQKRGIVPRFCRENRAAAEIASVTSPPHRTSWRRSPSSPDGPGRP